MPTPKVSVLLSSYNHEAYIAHAISSALAQTFHDFELLIYDDASTDNSLDVIQSFSDPRIRVFTFPANGKIATLKKVLPHARGQYIAMLHSDDAWMPDKLEKQVAWLDANPDCGAVFTLVQAMDDDNQPTENTFADIFQQPNRSRWEWLRELFWRNVLCHPSVLIRTDIYQTIHVSRMQLLLNDWRGWIRLCLQHDIHILQEKLTWFRVHSTGIINDGGPSLRNTIRAENEISFLLELYRQLDSPDDWLAVFPEAKQYVVDGRIIPDYALAHICISTHIPAYTQYGLHLLALSMDTEEQISTIYRLYTFTANDYIDLCARSRVFHDQPLAVLHRPMFQIMHNYTPIEKYTQQLDLFTYADKSFHIAFSIALLPEELTQEPYTVFVNISSSIGWICQLSSCTVDGVPQKAIPQGSQKTSEGDAFFSNAPLYALPNLARGSILEFKGTLQAISTQALLEQNAKLERMVLRMSQRLKEGKR